VMEYLTGSWDAYWMMQSNDGAYQDPVSKKWYYLPQGNLLFFRLPPQTKTIK
jgi:hypothetical protein